MGKGLAIVVGLNKIDEAAYEGYNVSMLGVCEKSAIKMEKIVTERGYQLIGGQPLLGDQATQCNFKAHLASARETMVSGDILFIFFSGHGGQMASSNPGTEMNLQDETLGFYDGQMIDDELLDELNKFDKGLRIFIVLECCHSEGVVAAYMIGDTSKENKKTLKPFDFKSVVKRKEKVTLNPCVLALSAISEDDVVESANALGRLTLRIATVLKSGTIGRNYQEFTNELRKDARANEFILYDGFDTCGMVNQYPFEI